MTEINTNRKNKFYKHLLTIRGQKTPVLRSELKKIALDTGIAERTFYEWIKNAQSDGHPLGGWQQIQIGINKVWQDGRRDTIYFHPDAINEVLPLVNERYPKSNLGKVASTLKKQKGTLK